MTYFSPQLAEAPRSLQQVRAALEVQLHNKRVEQRLLVTEYTGEIFSPRFRTLYREIAALKKRIKMFNAEIGERT